MKKQIFYTTVLISVAIVGGLLNSHIENQDMIVDCLQFVEVTTTQKECMVFEWRGEIYTTEYGV